jgi:MFS transporter, PPP family, 3-phenylpropionic acid transporter
MSETGSDPFRPPSQKEPHVRGKGSDPATLAARISLLFAALFVSAGTQLPYLPVWLDWVGLSPREIAVIAAAPMVVRVAVTPAIAFAADRSGDHRRFLIALAWSGLAAAVALAQCASFWPILLLTLLFAVAASTNMALAETVAMRGVTRAGLDYGRMRLWGSLSFIGATFCGGLVVDRLGPPAVVWLVVAGVALTALAAHGLDRGLGSIGHGDTPSAAAAAAAPGPRIRLVDALGLLRSRLFLTFLLAVGAVQSAHAAFYAFGTLHWLAQGISSGWAGVLWTIGVAVEIGLMAFSKAVVARIGAAELIVLGAAASVVRWGAMGLDPPLPVLVLLQALHGLTFGATHIGAFYMLAQTVAERHAGTAQALYAATTAGLAMGGAMLLSGQLYATWGGRTYWAMAALAAVGLGAGVALRRCGAGRALRV